LGETLVSFFSFKICCQWCYYRVKVGREGRIRTPACSLSEGMSERLSDADAVHITGRERQSINKGKERIAEWKDTMLSQFRIKGLMNGLYMEITSWTALGLLLASVSIRIRLHRSSGRQSS
jgi:hypothetical protein